MTLLQSEQNAKTFVEKIGLERANKLLTKVCNRIQKRIDKANTECIGQFFDYGSIRKADWEIDLIYNLKLGITLLDDYFTPLKAKERIRQRIAERKTKNKGRLAEW